MREPRESSSALLEGICTCTRRLAAQASGEFVYLPHARAWVFTTDDAPVRAMTWRAKYYAGANEDHSGEPFRFVNCVWCGRELPGTADLSRPALPPGSQEGSE